uniref:BTB domain-containing protein n=1 Tax=Caenorhabditis tropicalis TaxID=1561998 RepID=A0A1I7SY72_9PELO
MSLVPETQNSYQLIFQLPALQQDNGRGYVTMAQEAENVYWRVGLLGSGKGCFGCHLMCNSEDRSNYWSIDIEYQASLLFQNKEHYVQKGKHHHMARKYLPLGWDLDIVKKFATKDRGLFIQFKITILDKVGIRQKRIHDFSKPEPNLCNLTLIVEGEKIHCSKQILAMNSEFFMELLYPDGNLNVSELKLPSGFEYSKILGLIKVIYNDSDALNPANIDEILELATNLKADNARNRCEKWITKTQLITAKRKVKIAEKYSLVDLQNECVTMLKTSQQVQRLFENPSRFTDSEIVDLMDKVTLSIVGRTYEGFANK